MSGPKIGRAGAERTDTAEWELTGGRVAARLGAHWGSHLGREIFLNFQVKNSGFYAFFVAKNYTVVRNRDQRA